MDDFQPKYHISPKLLASIKRITLLIHQLNQQALSTPILADLQTEARTLSTFASTSIEGNPLPLTEVRRLLKNQPAQARQSEQEVLNYNRALLALNENLAQPFTTQLLLQIHHWVTESLLPKHQSGQFRQEAVVVYEPRTGEIVYLPPDYGDVEPLVEQLVRFVQAYRGTLDPLLLAGIFHKQFVVIHPFVDGNGRSTRLATKLLLAGLGLDTFNLLSFENYYNQNVTRYFERVGLFGNYYDLAAELDFTEWLEYFADGILDELLRLQKQLEQRQSSPQTQLEPHHQLILAIIDKQGFVTDRMYSEQTTRAKATRIMDFNKLIEMGLIVREGRARATYYQRA